MRITLRTLPKKASLHIWTQSAVYSYFPTFDRVGNGTYVICKGDKEILNTSSRVKAQDLLDKLNRMEEIIDYERIG